MDPNKILHYLQTRSHRVKTNIVVGVAALAVLGLGSTWVNTLQSQLGGLGKDDVLPGAVAGSTVSAENRITVESKEVKNGKTYLHFKVINETSDILSFSPDELITLDADDKKITPEKVLDRQQKEFVKKVLSNSTSYGTLVFPEIKDSRVKLTFDDMYFDQFPERIFMEVIHLELSELKPVEELRS